MPKNRLHRTLSQIVEVKPGEEIIALLLFCYFFLITAPWGIIKSVRDAKYLIELDSTQLPVAYLLTAIIMGFVVAFHSKLQAKIPRGTLISSSLIFFLVSCFIFGLLFLKQWTWMPVVFWVWANVFIMVLMTQFWILVNDIFNPREAKRLIGFFVSGGILGGILGYLLTGSLGGIIPDYLLFIACGMLIASVLTINAIFRWQRKKISSRITAEKKDEEKRKGPKKVGFKVCFDTVRKNYYLKLISAVITITLIISTFIDWQFKTVIEITKDVDEMTSFFGYFNLGLLIFAFLLQLLITSNLIKRYGIRFSLLVYPLILLFCFIGIAAAPAFIPALLIKGSDKSFSFSLNQSVRELLYIPVSSELKYKAKIFIDIFVNRFAKGIGALILMIVISIPFIRPMDTTISIDAPKVWGPRILTVSIISVLLIVLWVFLNLKLSKEYTNIVKQQLDMKWERADKLVDEKLDVNFMKLVLDTLESKNRSSVLYAMDVFDLIKQDKLTPEVKKLIAYKQDEMRASSFGSLLEGGEMGLIPEMDDFLSEEVLEKEIKEIMSLDVYQDLMKDYIDKVLIDKEKKAETAKMEVARALGFMESESPLTEKLEELLLDESSEVIRYAIESAARLKRREHIPTIIQKLLSPSNREDAVAALEKYGAKITGTLSDYLGESQQEVDLRKGVATVLARIGTQDAVNFLAWELNKSNGDIDTELIDALDRIRSEKSDIQFPEEILRLQIGKVVKNYYQIFIKLHDSKLESKKADGEQDLSKSLDVILMNIFRLMGLIYSYEDINKAYQNIKSGTKRSVAYAIELLDNILPREINDVLFPIIEDLPIEERLKRCLNLLKTSPIFKKAL